MWLMNYSVKQKQIRPTVFSQTLYKGATTKNLLLDLKVKNTFHTIHDLGSITQVNMLYKLSNI